MRKKIYGIACLLLFAVVMLTGCGHQSVEQTWYSDRDDQSTLTLKDGQYTDSGWLTTGQYTTKENTITLTSAVDGTHELQIQKDNNGNTVLFFDNGQHSHTYYSDADAAEFARENRIAADKAVDTLQKAEDKKQLKETLPGYWIPVDTETYPIIFEENGTIISYEFFGNTDHEKQLHTYKVTDDGISVTVEKRLVVCKAKLQDDGTLQFNGDKNVSITYKKVAQLELSKNILNGEWTNKTGDLTLVFDSGTFYTKSKALVEVPERTNYTVVGYDTAMIDGEIENMFLSESKTKYYLIVVRPVNKNSDATYATIWTRRK